MTKIFLQSDSKRPSNVKAVNIFSLFFHLDVESLVTNPNNKKADFLNDDLLLTSMVHIMPKNCNF